MSEPIYLNCLSVGEDKFLDWFASTHGSRKYPCVDCTVRVWVNTERVESVNAGVRRPVCGSCAEKRRSAAKLVVMVESVPAAEIELLSREIEKAKNEMN